MKAAEEKTLRDPLISYFQELSGMPVMGREEEIEAFKGIEGAEARVVSLLMESPPFPALELLAQMAQSETCLEAARTDGARMASLKHALEGGLPKRLVGPFTELVRLSEAGRSWMEAACLESTEEQIEDDGPMEAEAGKKARRREGWAEDVKRAVADSSAKKSAFVRSNLKLVVAVAKKYHKSWMSQSLNDLIQDGNIGLMRAVDSYDLRKGFKFSTYSMWWIRHHVQRSISDREAQVRIPVHAAEASYVVRKMVSKHLAQTGEVLSEKQLVERTGMTLAKVRRALSARRVPAVSLDTPMGPQDPEFTLSDVLVDPERTSPLDDALKSALEKEVSRALRSLTPVESKIIRWRFGVGGDDSMTLQQIGEIMDLSRERIRQIESRALAKLRKNTPLGREGL